MMHMRSWPLLIGLQWVIAAVICVVPVDAHADQEGRAPLTRLLLDSKGLDGSGSIHVEGEQSEQGLASLSVSAFGKAHVLTSAQLEVLRGMEFNTIGLTYSRGYPDTGGRSVFVLLCQGFSSGVKIIATVTVTETQGIRLKKEIN